MGLFSDLNSGGVQRVADEPETGGLFRKLNGGGTEAAAPAKSAADPNAEPDAATWLGRRVQDIRGKTDARYKDLPVYSGHNVGATVAGNVAQVAGANDDAFADIIGKHLGPRHIRTFKDANGYPIIEYQGDDGKPKQEYVNRPGLDMTDIGRGAAAAVPYVLTGGAAGAAMKTAPMAVQAIGQGITAAATNVGAQGARSAAGSDQGFDASEAMIMGGLGAAAPIVGAGLSAGWRKLVTEPSLFNKTTGQLTPKGMEAAKRAGLDPAELSPDAAKSFGTALARSGDEAMAATQAATQPYNIRVTKGQLTKDPYLLTQEEAMARRLYGENAQATMRQFREDQSRDIASAALGSGEGPSIARMINPDRAANATGTQALGQSIGEGAEAIKAGAKAGETAAWKNVPKMKPTAEALDALPEQISQSVGSRVVDEATPAAARMGKALDDFIAGTSPKPVAGVFKSEPVQDVDRMRRQLLSMRNAAETGEDKAATKAVYDGFNNWIDHAVESNLIAGDAGMAANLKIARSFTRDMHTLLEPKTMGGQATPGAQRLSKLLEDGKVDSAEGLVQSLLGPAGAKSIPAGSVEALQNFRTALQRYAPDVAEATWNDIRLAHWVRLVQGRTGEMLGPTAIMSNIKTAMANQRSVMQTLYAPEELAQISMFNRAMEAVALKPPNASGSGYTAVGLGSDMLGKLFQAFGLNTRIVRGAMDLTGATNAYGGAAARQAINPTSAVPASRARSAVVGAGAIYNQERQ